MVKALSVLLLCVASGVAQTTQQATPPAEAQLKDCDDARIRYSPIEPQFATRLVVEKASGARPTGDTKASPQKTRWMQVVAPDYSKRGPWTTTIWIGTNDDQTSMKLTIHDHEGFEVEWLNEKLIYGTVSWSKTMSTDFVFDVEAQKFIYREMEDSADLSAPCE